MVHTTPSHGSASGGIVGPGQTVKLTVERTTQTERRVPKWRMLLYCLMGDDQFRRQRQREAAGQLGIIIFSNVFLMVSTIV